MKIFLITLLMAAGLVCTPAFAQSPDAEVHLDTVRTLYDSGQYQSALKMLESIEAASDSTVVGLTALRDEIRAAALDAQGLGLIKSPDLSRKKMMLDAREQEVIPDSYGRVRRVSGETASHVQDPGRLWQALDSLVTLHLQDVELPTLLGLLAEETGLNMISDHAVGAGKKINIDVDGVPLREVIEYLKRHFNIAFHYGESTAWVLPAGSEATIPMQTRIFRLRRGIQSQGADWPNHVDPKSKVPAPAEEKVNALSSYATVMAQDRTYIETVIEQFIPVVKEAQLHFDRNTHTLFVRNTPANLHLIAKLLDALDISPPQVLIEARFVEVRMSDLRELGVDWILDSPLVASSKSVIGDDGIAVRNPRSIVDPGTLFSAVPFRSDEQGVFPLGPQGAFGENTPGNPPTAGQGLNLSYRGVLTDPMFQAVIHALDISGKGQTLSVPRVTTVNNTPAKLRDGEDLLYFDEFEAQAFSLLDDNNKKVNLTALIPKGKPLKEELGITLVAVPSVGSDMDTVSLLLTPTISRLERFVSYQDETDVTPDSISGEVKQVVVKLPVIARRAVQTKVQVRSGETVVMGGLIDTVSQDTEHRVPILSSIPLIGRLFRREDVTEERKNLLIFVTATVIGENGESLIAEPPGTPVPRPGKVQIEDAALTPSF